jgi:DNA repair exonuclease SbcCD ATPase subunit
MLVRQGLKDTNPKLKENSSRMETNPEIEALNKQIKELQESKAVSSADHKAVVDELTAVKAELATLTTTHETLKSALAEKDSALAEVKAKELSAVRYAELEKILAFSDAEKNDEKHGDYVKSLASLTESDFKIAKLERENTKLTAALKSGADKRILSSAPVVNPVGDPAGNQTPALGIADVYVF